MARSREDILDELLVLRSQEGDAEAMRELVCRWQPRLWRHARRMMGEGDAASEALQEAWLSIVRGLPRLHDPAAFRAWAYRIVSRRCADWIRRRQKERQISTSKSMTGEGEPAETAACDCGDEVARVHRSLKSLPAQQRSVLSLFYLEGMSIREIANALDIPEGTVKSRLHSARNTLRETLERTGQ